MTAPITRIPFGATDLFPVVFDFDLKKMRPRGVATRLDFFSRSELTTVIEESSFNGIAFIKKRGLFFENGFFVMDYAEALKKPAKTATTIKEMGLSAVHFEHSPHFDLSPIIDRLDGIDVGLLEFS